jgi:hypothetical protein
LVQEKLATMAAYTYAMESATYLTAGLVDHGVEDFMLESAILKVFSSDALWQIVFDTMQIYGGRSFFTDKPFERIMRDSRLNTIGEGSNEVMRVFIGVVGMRDVGVFLKDTVDALKNPFGNMTQTFEGLKQLSYLFRKPKIPVVSTVLESDARRLETTSKKFAQAIFSLLKTYREKIVDKQLELNRIAEAAMGIYAAYATLSRLDHELRKKSEATLEVDLATGKYFLEIIERRILKALSEIGSPLDAMTTTTSNILTGYSHS